jgi:hypothetical protein
MKSGLAVQEQPIQAISKLETEIMKQYTTSVDLFDPFKEDMIELFGESPRESVVSKIKVSILEAYVEGSKLWTAYKNLKSDFANNWAPFDVMTSGENEDDALEKIRRNVWCQRQNKAIKQTNKKAKTEEEIKDEVKPENAPEATPSNLPLETIAFKAFRNHSLIAIKKKGTSSNNLSSGSSEESSTAESTDDKVAKLLKSRKQQRADLIVHKKKQKVEATVLNNQERKTALAVKVSQAEAAKTHADALKEKNKLEFLKLAHQFNYAGVQSLMETVAKSMFASDVAATTNAAAINLASKHDGSDDESVLSVEQESDAE